MRRHTTKTFLLLKGLAVLGASVSPGLAQDSGLLPQRNEPSTFAKRSSSSAADAKPAGQSPSREKIASPDSGRVGTKEVGEKLEIRGFRFVKSDGKGGSIGLEPSLGAALDAAARRGLGVPEAGSFSVITDLATLSGLSQVLSLAYREQTGVFAPIFVLGEQDVTDGILTFRLHEGLLESLELQHGAAATSEEARGRLAYAESVLTSQSAGLNSNVLKDAELERVTMLLEELTDYRYSVQMRAGATPLGIRGTLFPSGQGVLPTFEARFRLDNQGSPSLGQNQLSATLFWRPAQTPFADQFNVNYMLSDKGSALASLAMGYEAPVGLSGLRAGIRGSHLSYEIGGSLQAAQVTGRADTGSVYAGYPLVRSRAHRVDMTVTLTGANQKDVNVASSNPRKLTLATAEIRGDSDHGRGGRTSWAVGTTASDLSFDTAAQRAGDVLGLQGGCTLLSYEFSHFMSIGSGLDVSFLTRGQFAQGNLDSFQKMSIGGMNGVRAFAPTESNGDDAQLARFEVGQAFPLLGAQHRLALFYDYGRVSINHAPIGGSGNDIHLSGYGIQWQFLSEIGLASRLYFAVPMTDSSRTLSTVDGDGSRVGWDLSYSF